MVTAAPRIGVVVVCWNNEELLPQCLNSVRAQTAGAESIRLVVVDNDSSDGSVALLRSSYPEAEVIEVGRNSKFSHANNLGIRRVFEDPSVEGVVLLNSDAWLAPEWVERVVGFARTRPLGAAFQSLTVAAADPGIVDSTHLYLGRSLHAFQGSTLEAVPAVDVSERVYGVNAAACYYTRAFLEAQPFEDYLDETMAMYLEDVDLATRALAMGWEAWHVEGTCAYHIGSASTKKQASGFALRQTWRNQTLLLVTNLPWRLLLRGAVGLVKHDIGAMRHLRVHGDPALVNEIVRGRLEGLRLIPMALRRRRALRPLRVLDAESLWELMGDGRSLR